MKEVKEEIQTIFIFSEDTGISGSGNTIELSIKQVEMLGSSNIHILKYNKILAEAEKMYIEHLRYQAEEDIRREYRT